METPLLQVKEISQWLNIPTLSVYYKHNFKENENCHLQALQDYFALSDLSISYQTLFAEAKFLARIFLNTDINTIVRFLREVGQEPNRIRIAARKLCFICGHNEKENSQNKMLNNIKYDGAASSISPIKKEEVGKRSIEKNNKILTNDCHPLKKTKIIEKTDHKNLENGYPNELNTPLSLVDVSEVLQKVYNKVKPKENFDPPTFTTDMLAFDVPYMSNNTFSCLENITVNGTQNNKTMKENQNDFSIRCNRTSTVTTSTNSISDSVNFTNPSKEIKNVSWSNFDNSGLLSVAKEKSESAMCNVSSTTTNSSMDLFSSNNIISYNSKMNGPESSNLFKYDADNSKLHESKNLKESNVPIIKSHNVNNDIASTSGYKDQTIINVPLNIDEEFSSAMNYLEKSKNSKFHLLSKEQIGAYDSAVLKEGNTQEIEQAKRLLQTIKTEEIPSNMVDDTNVNKPQPVLILTVPGTMDVELLDDLSIEAEFDLTQDDTEVKEDNIEIKESDNNRMVYQLMEIFPQACPNYLRNICKNKLNTPNTIENIITQILSGDYPKRKIIEEEPKEVDAKELFEYLKEVLPNADPTYLEIKADMLTNKPDDLKVFIANALEKHNYPTMKDYLRRVKLSSQQKQYTTNFSVETFLEVIPDPFGYFEDPTRKSNLRRTDGDWHYVIAFLKNKYPTIAVRTIAACKVYAENLIKICNYLDHAKPMKSKRRIGPLPQLLENIPLLQEIAFIEHKEEIKNYLVEQKIKQDRERQLAKQSGILKTCNCCYDDEIMPNDIARCNKDCIFCKGCVRRSIEVAFGDGKLQFMCITECDSEFSLQTLQNVLNPKLFSKIALKKQVEEVKAAGIEDLESCPFCDFVTIPAREDKLFRCLNPDCMKESCRQCKEPSHVPLRCDEVEKDDDVKARVYIENKMAEAMMRQCYKCGMKFVKSDGCNKISCSCGASMCYVCNKPVKDYKHFNGLGGSNFHLCPLYSDTEKMHKENVLKSAIQAKAEIGKETLKIDPTADIQDHYSTKSNVNPLPLYDHGHHQQILQDQAIQFLGRYENWQRLDRIDENVREILHHRHPNFHFHYHRRRHRHINDNRNHHHNRH